MPAWWSAQWPATFICRTTGNSRSPRRSPQHCTSERRRKWCCHFQCLFLFQSRKRVQLARPTTHENRFTDFDWVTQWLMFVFLIFFLLNSKFLVSSNRTSQSSPILWVCSLDPFGDLFKNLQSWFGTLKSERINFCQKFYNFFTKLLSFL